MLTRPFNGRRLTRRLEGIVGNGRPQRRLVIFAQQLLVAVEKGFELVVLSVNFLQQLVAASGELPRARGR